MYMQSNPAHRVVEQGAAAISIDLEASVCTCVQSGQRATHSVAVFKANPDQFEGQFLRPCFPHQHVAVDTA
jgi:hypothetical protein